jgi:cytidine deaminase
VVDEEQQWRVDFLLFRTVDLAAMEAKAIARQYTSLAEFEADAATIVHNIIIYHGGNINVATLQYTQSNSIKGI